MNGFFGFLKYATLTDARKANLYEAGWPVPLLFDAMSENGDTQVIEVGDTLKKEFFGDSLTRVPETYKFSMGGSTVRLVDTPGLHDTRGIEFD